MLKNPASSTVLGPPSATTTAPKNLTESGELSAGLRRRRWLLSGLSDSRRTKASREAGATLGQLAAEKLNAICSTLGLEKQQAPMLELVDCLLDDWARAPLKESPYWSSDITDDGTPFEYSVAFSAGRRQLRLLVEAQSSTPSPTSTWNAGLLLNQRLAERFGATLEGFEEVRSLFAPTGSSSARFLLWHGAVPNGSESPLIKVYLNPTLSGGPRTAKVVTCQALERLGLVRARNFAESAFTHELPIYFSLDLLPMGRARVKVYTALVDWKLETIAARVAECSGIAATQALDWLNDLTQEQRQTQRPILACYNFRTDQNGPDLTVHVPVRCYAQTDAESVTRASRLLSRPDALGLLNAVQRMARGRPMNHGALTYVSVKYDEAEPTVTAYLAPQAYTKPHVADRESPHYTSFIRELNPRPAASHGEVTLADIQACIDQKQRLFAGHEFYAILDRSSDMEHARLVASRIAFFVLCFQDVLRLAHEHILDPELKDLAKTHRREDAGHEQWFLRDLTRLGVACDAQWLFSAHHRTTRDVAYAQIARVSTCRHDHGRVAVALCLESIGAVFFERMISFLERMGRTEGLEYFARSHQEVEQHHQLFAPAAQRSLASIAVPADVIDDVLDVVDSTFWGMMRINDELTRMLSSGKQLVIPRTNGALAARAEAC